MANLLNIPKNEGHYYVLSLILCLFIIFPVEIPSEVARIINSVLGKVVIVILVLNLFMANYVAGTVAIVAAYELVRRSESANVTSGGLSRKYIPTERVKTGNLNAINQFPVTVEEIVIQQKIPYTFNLSTNPGSPYLPTPDDTHDAEALN